MPAPQYGLVLAGGRSSRMGQDKGALIWHKRPQAQHLAELLAPHVEQVFVSVREEQMPEPHLRGLKLIADHYASPSPLNGIASAMRAVPTASLMVVAVDMPHIDRPAIETLIAGRNPAMAATCFESPAKGGPDPLFAIWENHIFAMLDALLAERSDHICPRRLLKSLPIQLLDGIEPAVLDNINTPEEYRTLRAEAS